MRAGASPAVSPAHSHPGGTIIFILDNTSKTPPFEQVRTELARQINDSTLPVGTKLPTVRKFADDLGIAPNTVARAYRELEEAGLLETRGRAGTFVSASGDQSRRRAQEAAAEYAAITQALGLNATEALNIAKAALNQ